MFYRIAIANNNQGDDTVHFGSCSYFRIIEVDGNTNIIKDIGIRKRKPFSANGDENETALHETVQAFADCRAMIIHRMGMYVKNGFVRANIDVFEVPRFDESAILRLIRFYKKTSKNTEIE